MLGLQTAAGDRQSGDATAAGDRQSGDAAAATDADGDAALVAAARADPAAFAPLYARYLRPVYRYCYLRLGDRVAAEDATSENFVKALAGLPGYRDRSFGGWLFTIAHNVVTDTMHRRRLGAPLEVAGDPADTAPTPEQAALTAEGRRALLDLLPEDQRAVVTLRLAGLSGAEIARALGRSLGAVKSLQFRAMARLRASLSGEETSNDRP